MNQLNCFSFNEPPLFTVTQFKLYVNELLSSAPVLVEGEVSNYREIKGRPFCYFDIKDDQSVVKCFQLFNKCSFRDLKNGTKIKVYGFPNLQRNGSLVIDVHNILLSGKGALMEAYLKLKEKLQKEGLFDEQYKKPLPKFPRTIGLIAGKNSSAYHDVTVELKERWKGIQVFFLASKVQGLYASKEILRAIQWFNKNQPVDVLIIARGGGSMEDLQAFDSEEVVREIFASKIPIISAIGHEDHWTLADFVSDMRAKTPTKAAQIAVPDKDEINERLKYFFGRMKSLLEFKIQGVDSKIDFFKKQLNQALFSRVFQQKQKISLLESGLVSGFERYLRSRREKLLNLENQLKLLDPQSVLRRGYSIVEKDGQRVTSIDQVKAGQQLKITLPDGEIDGRVEGTKKF